MIRRASPFARAFCLGACGIVAGCAAPGEPSPRHPVVPVAVSDLTARQYGNAVSLVFTLPEKSTQRESLEEPPALEIYRSALPPGAVPDRKTSWRLVYTIPSERVDSYKSGERIEFHDPLTADDAARPPGSSLAYKVRTRETKARASEDSNVVTARIYAAPDAPRDVRVSALESAIVVSWSPPALPQGAPSPSYRVYRGEPEGEEEASPADFSQVKLKMPLELLGPSNSTEFRDTQFQFGTAYVYTVRAVAQFGSDSVESADSAPAIVTPRDVFPPAAPKGLEVAIIPATPQSPAYVELSWAIGPEPDLAGYIVYRSDAEDTPGERVSPELLPSPTFRDISVLPGKRYFYRVTAVDRAGNESPKSAAAQADIP